MDDRAIVPGPGAPPAVTGLRLLRVLEGWSGVFGDPVRTGGLFRCCLESIDRAPAGREGDRIPCLWDLEDGVTAVFRDGAWEWVGARRAQERAGREAG